MSWAPPWRGVLGAQWTAPLAKAPPPPPPNPPHEHGLSPQYRSEKRRKLQDQTAQLLREPWNLDEKLIETQEECFQGYETVIGTLSSKLMNRDTCIYEQKQNMNALQKQLSNKINLVRRKNNEVSILRGSNITLKTQIDSLSMRIATDASEHEEKITHYKSLIKGLQKTAENAEESSQYLRHMRYLLFEYEQGESLEDTLKTSDRKCSICMENNANIVCFPCMHLEFCSGCALHVHNLNMGIFTSTKRCNVESKCPRCKGDVNELMYIFT
jgi:hypothetical protein